MAKEFYYFFPNKGVVLRPPKMTLKLSKKYNCKKHAKNNVNRVPWDSNVIWAPLAAAATITKLCKSFIFPKNLSKTFSVE